PLRLPPSRIGGKRRHSTAYDDPEPQRQDPIAPHRIPAGEAGPVSPVRRNRPGCGLAMSPRSQAGLRGDDSVAVESLDLGGEVLVDEVALERLLGREIAV